LSALTKLFVVLLVVCSLMLSAAVVVFVNRVPDFQKEAQTATQQKQQAVNQANLLSGQLTMAQANLKAANQNSNDQIVHLRGEIESVQGQLAAKNVDLAKAANEAAIKDAQLTGVTGALKASEEENKTLQGQLAEIRQSNDKYITQNRDLNISVSELTARNDSLDKQRKYLEEKDEQNKKQVSQMNSVMARAGIKYDQESGEAVQAGQPVVGTPGPIDGVITATQTIGGVKYATISIGSSDNVAKGMKFYVINRSTGEFYGTLVVDNVQPNEAIGQLAGPKTQNVEKGSEVKTQL